MDIEARLTKIEALLAKGKAEQPEAMLDGLIRQMGQQTLTEWRPTLEPVIQRFFPKRRRALQALLDARLSGRPLAVREPVPPPAYPPQPGERGRGREEQFREDLRELSKRHIFQWATSYRDCLFRHFDLFLAKSEVTAHDDGLLLPVRRCLSEHSHEIFSKGYGHERDVKDTTHFDAIQKSIAGLVRFLDLPLDFYSIRATSTYKQNDIVALRSLFSAAAIGIVEGYAAVDFADDTGRSLLPRSLRRWGHNLAFLTPTAASKVAGLVKGDPLADGIESSVIPLLSAIDRLIRKEREDYFPLPLLGRFSWPDRLLEISLRAPLSGAARRAIETRAYLEEGDRAFPLVLTEARARNVTLIVAPIRPHVREFVRERDTLAAIVVNTNDEDPRNVVERSVEVLDRTIYSLRSKRTGPGISHNIAREFPLTTPKMMSFYRVERTSVRNLLNAFDRTNGARLWCSVRRSGKTTACFGLDFTAADSVIVIQTCGMAPAPSDRHLFDKVCAAIEAGSRLDPDFVEATTTACSPVAPEGRRKVLIIDEYETLFGFLRAAARRDDYVRYTVVQPLLNQFVEFARGNLLVLLGQQPDAHFFLMDQNQLAPYVRQDPFPLFEHVSGSRAGEFGELVAKVFTDRINYDPGFIGALHGETAGHPFLTVNLLCSLVDWLIEQKRPYRGLLLQEEDLVEFESERLRASHLAISSDYDFFRQALKEAMGRRGYDSNPWLFSVYWVLREICGAGPNDWYIGRNDLADVMRRIPAPGPLPDANDILRTASQANFLSYDADRIRVKIRILGRLANAIRPGLA